jgi:hypothetical protein
VYCNCTYIREHLDSPLVLRLQFYTLMLLMVYCMPGSVRHQIHIARAAWPALGNSGSDYQV